MAYSSREKHRCGRGRKGGTVPSVNRRYAPTELRFKRPPAARGDESRAPVVLMVSGGADSTALVVLAATSPLDIDDGRGAQRIMRERLHILHVNHQLRGIDAEEDEDPEESAKQAMEKRSDLDAVLLGGMLAKTVAGWGNEEAVRQATDQGSKKKVYKEWITGENARESHQLMDGERVPIDEPFSNGADWPGDDTLDPDESCGCNCSTQVIITEE